MSTSGPAARTYLVRLGGEVTTKSRRVRQRFQQKLVQNLRDALTAHQVPFRHVENQWSRLLVRGDDSTAGVLRRVFGVQSFSPIEGFAPCQLEQIVRVGTELYHARVQGRRYAVRAHRSGGCSLSAQRVNETLGAALNPGAKVDLDHPDITVHVLMTPQGAMFYHQVIPGPGGLPVGVQGKAVALISGGFDSAVAAWHVLRRGVELHYVFFNLAGAAYQRLVVSVAKVLSDLWSYGYRPELHVVDFEPVVRALRSDVNPKYVQVVLKRLMYRAGCQVAREIDAQALVTGEALGQVSSQTLKNLAAIQPAADLLVLRPLVGLDKEDIIAQSRQVGTYALSSKVQEYCALVPEKPVTAARIEAVDNEEGKLPPGLLAPLVAQRRVLDLRSLDISDLVVESIYIDHVPPGAEVVDCRPEYQYEAWHYPGAVNLPLEELIDRFKHLDRQRTYVLYCPFGLQSAAVAEKMQQAGYEAYSFRGGTAALRRWMQQQGIPQDDPLLPDPRD